jgi:diguanylate cyclase (GGDEF)-like protein
MPGPDLSAPRSRTGMLLDGPFATEAVDTSAEVASIKGMDVSSMEAGEGTANSEHINDDGGKPAQATVGKVVYVHKILKEDDCEDERQLMWWKRVGELPYLYGIVRLYDAAGHPEAQAIAAQVRDHVANDEPILVRWSIEGQTVERDGNHLTNTIARRVACTIKPCNKTAFSGMLLDPQAPEGFDKVGPDIAKHERLIDPEFSTLAKTEFSYVPFEPSQEDRVRKLVVDLSTLAALAKALEAGSADGAPGTRTGGSALQREDRTLRGNVLAAIRDYGDHPFSRGQFRTFAKARLPEVSDEYLDRFADMAEEFRLKKHVREAVPAPKGAPAKVAKPKKAPQPVEDLDDDEEDLDTKAPPIERGTFRGQPVPVKKGVGKPVFDSKEGVLHTPIGSFRAYLPKHDGPLADANYKKLLSSPGVEKVMDHAIGNWLKLHRRLKAGKLPAEVVAHAVIFSQLSPNTPVPTQELQYCLDSETIIPACRQDAKRIKDFKAGDVVWGVDASGASVETTVVALHDHGIVNGVDVEFSDGYTVTCSLAHKFLTPQGMVPMGEIWDRGLEVLCEPSPPGRRLVGEVRGDVQDRGLVQESQEGVSGLQGRPGEGSLGERHPLAKGESRGGCRSHEEGMGGLGTASEGRSSSGHGGDSQMGEGEAGGVRRSAEEGCGGYEALAAGESRGILQTHLRGAPRGGKEVSGGASRGVHGERSSARDPWGGVEGGQSGGIRVDFSGVPGGGEEVRFEERVNYREIGGCDAAGLEPGSDTLRRGEEAGRPDQPGSQDVGGGGRVPPLLRSRQEGEGRGTPEQGAGAGRDAEFGSRSEGRRDSGASEHGVLLDQVSTSERGVGGVVDGHAPITSTGRLVRRAAVRVSPVGPRRMYDLEVSHSEHNFVLPSGIVTSNSRLHDAMKETGLDPTKPGFSAIMPNLLAQDKPDVGPKLAAAAIASDPRYRTGTQLGVQHDAAGNKMGDPSAATGRYPGEYLSISPLLANKMKNVTRYHEIHDKVVDLVQRHRHDMTGAIAELMKGKNAGNLARAAAKRAAAKGIAPAAATGPAPVSIPGLKVKTGLYTYGMLGGGNSIVPDTHFIRNMFGLDLKKDKGTIEYLKRQMWNSNNVHLVKAYNDWYVKNHPAAQYTLKHPKWGKHFASDPSNVAFPAFWRHWITIRPHEHFLGMGRASGHNEATVHEPYWAAVRPLLEKAQFALDLPARTAEVHRRYCDLYGEVPASMMYYQHLVPELLAEGDQRARAASTYSFLAKAQLIEEAGIELRKAVADALDPVPAAAPVVRQVLAMIQGKSRPIGRYMIHDGQVHHLEDYHGILASVLPEGPVNTDMVARLHGLSWAPDLTVEPHEAPQTNADGTAGNGAPPTPLLEVAESPPPPPAPVFEYTRAGHAAPHVLEFGMDGKAALDGSALDDAELALIMDNADRGLATIKYRQPPVTGGELAKAEGDVGDALQAIRAAVAAGHIHPDVERALTRHVYEDPMVPGVGNKYAYQRFRAENRPGAYLSMDLNDFKNVNDNFGHDAGDRAISGAGAAFRDAAAKIGTGKLFRPGGDEFVAHFPTHEEAALFARQATSGLDTIPPVATQVGSLLTHPHRLTTSIGIGNNFADADRALGQAKARKIDPITGQRAFPGGRTPHLAHSLVPGREGPIELHDERPPVPRRIPATQAA